MNREEFVRTISQIGIGMCLVDSVLRKFR